MSGRNAEELQAAIAQALEPLEERFGIEFSLYAESRSEQGAVFRVEAAVPRQAAEDGGEDGDLAPEMGAKDYWERYTRYFTDLLPEDFGAELVLNGRKLYIRGLNGAGQGGKETVRLQDEAGGWFLAGPEAVVRALGRKPAGQLAEEAARCNEAARRVGLRLSYGAPFSFERSDYILEGVDEEDPEYPIIGRDQKTKKLYRLPLTAGL